MNKRPLNLLDIALLLATFVLALATVFVLVQTPSTLGGGGVGVNVTFDGGREVRQLIEPAVADQVQRTDVVANVEIPKSDKETRAVMTASMLLMLGLAWVGLLALRRVVRSAVAGDPFVDRNVFYLRVFGAVLVAAPLVAALTNRLVDATLDVGGGRVAVADVDFTWIVAAIAAFALAEVFRRGSELRELEASTI